MKKYKLWNFLSIFFVLALASPELCVAAGFDTKGGLHCYREILSALSYPKYLKQEIQRFYDGERNLYYILTGEPDFPANTLLIIAESGVYSAVARPTLVSGTEGKADGGKIEIKGLPHEERIIIDYSMNANAKTLFSYLDRDAVAKDMEKNPLDRVQGKITATSIPENKLSAAKKAFQGSARDDWNLFHSSQTYFRQLMKNLGFTATDKSKAQATEEACKSTFYEANTSGCNDASIKCDQTNERKNSGAPEDPEATKSGAGSAK